MLLTSLVSYGINIHKLAKEEQEYKYIMTKVNVKIIIRISVRKSISPSANDGRIIVSGRREKSKGCGLSKSQLQAAAAPKVAQLTAAFKQ